MFCEIPGVAYGPDFLYRPYDWNRRTPPPTPPRSPRNRWRKARAAGRG